MFTATTTKIAACLSDRSAWFSTKRILSYLTLGICRMKRRARRAGSASKSSFLDPLLCSSPRMTVMTKFLCFLFLSLIAFEHLNTKPNGFPISIPFSAETTRRRKRPLRGRTRKSWRRRRSSGWRRRRRSRRRDLSGKRRSRRRGKRRRARWRRNLKWVAFGEEELLKVREEQVEEGGERTNLSGFIPRGSSANKLMQRESV